MERVELLMPNDEEEEMQQWKHQHKRDLLATRVVISTSHFKSKHNILIKTNIDLGGGLRLVVMGADSWSEGREFESLHWMYIFYINFQ